MSNYQYEERQVARGILIMGIGIVSCCIPGLQGVGAVAIAKGALKIGTTAAIVGIKEQIKGTKK